MLDARYLTIPAVALCFILTVGCRNPELFDYDGDCDDEDAAINPAAEEVLGDGVDQDCDGYDLLFEDDAEGQTHNATITSNPAEFVAEDLWTSVVDGEVVVSKGGFARVLINDSAGMGETITDTDGEVDLWLQVEAIPSIDVTHAVVLVNCDQVLEVPADDPDGVVKIDTHVAVPLTQDAHVVVLAYGEEKLPRGLKQFDPTGNPRATTNAIYVDVDGNGIYDPPGGKECVYDTE